MSPTLPYPDLSDTVSPVPALSRSVLEAGREAAFLDLDFSSTSRPELVTRLLALGERLPGATSDEPAMWRLSVSSRIKRLLRVTRETLGIEAFPSCLRCTHNACGQTIEIELPLAKLEALHDEADDGKLLQFPGPLAFRRPTGDDLRAWREKPESSTPDGVLRQLLVADPDRPATAELPSPEQCAEVFEEFDALVAFRISAACPHCGGENNPPLDLETLALARLGSLQQQLYRENHQLALGYGWSEADILRTPRHRRQRYLALLEGKI